MSQPPEFPQQPDPQQPPQQPQQQPPAPNPYGAPQQQPPYGQYQPPPQQGQPYGAPQPPYGQPGYPQPAYGQPLYQPPSNSNKTVWIVLAVIGVLIVLFCGGCLAVGAFFANEVDNAIDEELAGKTPHTITEGGEFQHDDYTGRKGWQITTDELGYFDIENLVVENNGRSGRTALLEFTLYDESNVIVADISCNSPTSLREGEAAELSCSSFTKVAEYDVVKVADEF